MKDLTPNEITTLSVLLSREYDRLNMIPPNWKSNQSVLALAEQEMTEIRDLWNKLNK